jgi:protein ImuA
VEIDELKMRVWCGKGAAAARAATRVVVPTGFPALDRFLPGGGWPIGAITEVLVDGYGIGELTLLMPALRALTQQGGGEEKKWVAWIAPPFVPYAPALEQHGIDADRILMIHPSHGDKNRLWATEQVVRSGSSCAVLAWIAVADDVMLRRMQLAAEDQACWVLLFRPEGIRKQRSPAALRIVLSQHAQALRVQVLKCRGGRPGIVDLSEPRSTSSGLATGAFS